MTEIKPYVSVQDGQQGGMPQANLQSLKAFLAAKREDAYGQPNPVKETLTREQYIRMANDIYDKLQHMAQARTVRGKPAPQKAAELGIDESPVVMILAKALGREAEAERIYAALKEKLPAFTSDSWLHTKSSSSICHLLMLEGYEAKRRAEMQAEIGRDALLRNHSSSPPDVAGLTGLYWLSIEAYMLGYRHAAMQSYQTAIAKYDEEGDDRKKGSNSLYEFFLRGTVACMLGYRDVAVDVMENRILHGRMYGTSRLYSPNYEENAVVALLALELAGTDFKKLVKR